MQIVIWKQNVPNNNTQQFFYPNNNIPAIFCP
jgi:hypothetical protein